MTSKTVKTAHTLRILSREGDTAVAWKPADTESTTLAEKQFNELMAKGYAMFATDTELGTKEQVRKFDPEAFEIVAVPQLQGG